MYIKLNDGIPDPAATSLEQISIPIIPQDQTLVANFSPIGELPFFDWTVGGTARRFFPHLYRRLHVARTPSLGHLQ